MFKTERSSCACVNQPFFVHTAHAPSHISMRMSIRGKNKQKTKVEKLCVVFCLSALQGQDGMQNTLHFVIDSRRAHNGEKTRYVPFKRAPILIESTFVSNIHLCI